MSRIFWDTNVFIYLFEDHSVYRAEVLELRRKMLRRGDELVTSWLTVGEIQVQPSAAPSRISNVAYKSAIMAVSRLAVFGEEAAESYLEIRNGTNVRGPDAMQLACAAASSVDLFVTNDKKLQGLRIPGVQFIVSIATAKGLL